MSLKQLCFSINGRINRKQYWTYVLVAATMLVIDFAVIATTEATFILGLPVLLFIIFANIAVTVKRLHDTNRSGWYVLVVLIPMIGAIGLISWCGIARGDERENRYGYPA